MRQSWKIQRSAPRQPRQHRISRPLSQGAHRSAARPAGYTTFGTTCCPQNGPRSASRCYSGQKPTFLTNNVMQMTYDLSRYGISDGQIVVGGIYDYDTWEPGGPNALSLATLSYYQTFLNKQVELKVGYLANALSIGGPFWQAICPPASLDRADQFRSRAALALASRETGDQHQGQWSQRALRQGFRRAGQRVIPDGPLAEKTANPTGLNWSTPNSGVLVIDEVGYGKDASPGQLASWVRAAPIVNTSRYVDFEFGGRNTGKLRGLRSGGSTICPTGAGRWSGCTRVVRWRQRNVRAAGVQSLQPVLRVSPLRDRASAVPGRAIWCPWLLSRNVFSNYVVDAALRNGQLAHIGNFSITAAYYAPIASGVRAGIRLGYTDHPTPVIYTPQTGSALTFVGQRDDVLVRRPTAPRCHGCRRLAASSRMTSIAPRTSRLKRLVYMWIAAAVVLLVSIGETDARFQSGETR